MLPAVVPRTRSMTGKCSLLRQKRRRLHEKRGERGQTDVGHSIRRVVARPPIRKGRAQSLEARHERFEHHAALESKRPRPVDESPRRRAQRRTSVKMRIAVLATDGWQVERKLRSVGHGRGVSLRRKHARLETVCYTISTNYATANANLLTPDA